MLHLSSTVLLNIESQSFLEMMLQCCDHKVVKLRKRRSN
uniref:Bm13466 n=1 Tax=Brugia malayi TaxID=6279 RepID=A0A1I9G2J6_BRUMA|nr:Bm13466 [Brugia malayi]